MCVHMEGVYVASNNVINTLLTQVDLFKEERNPTSVCVSKLEINSSWCE